MLRRTEGIVLKTFPFGEADLIVTCLTHDFGIIKLFAKSPRKIRSRFGSSLEPLTHSRISFWGKEDTALPKLTQSDILHSFQPLRDSLNCFLRVSGIIELTISFLPERDVNKKVYSLLLNTLWTLENNYTEFPDNSVKVSGCSTFIKGGMDGLEGNEEYGREDLVLNHYKIKFLGLAGFAPKLDACGRCGNRGYSFYLSQGSILCESCAKGIDLPIKLSPAVLRFYADLLTWDTAKIKRIRPSDVLLSELTYLINMHIKYILSKPLKSESFMHSFIRQ